MGRCRAVVGLFLVAVLVAGCGGHKRKVKASSHPARGWTVRLAAGGSGRVQAVAAPPNAERDTALQAVSGLVDVDPSGVARLRLVGGRLGSGGAVLTRRLSQPLGAGETAALMYFDAGNGMWRTVPSVVSPDRRTVTARVHHFSEWAAAILHGIAGLLGARADAPDCGHTPRPKWVDTAVYVDDQNAPLRVCVAGESGNNVLIKVAVNRGYGVRIHTAIAPTHFAIDLGDGPIDLISDGVVRAPQLVQLVSGHGHQDFPVLAGQTATFAFSESAVRASGSAPLISAQLDPFDAAVGTVFDLIVGKITDNESDKRVARAGAYIGAYATVAQCVGEIVKPFSQGHWSAAISGATKCLSDTAETVTTVTAGALADAFPRADTKELAGLSAKLGKALKALGAISIGLDATEWFNDHRLDHAGFEVHVFPAIKHPKPTVSLAAFTGTWYGHTRSLVIASSGLATEHINDGCCHPVLTIVFQLSQPLGTPTSATALARVVSVPFVNPSYFPTSPAPAVGKSQRIQLKNGVITESLTGFKVPFCNMAAELKGTCGA